MISFKNIFTIAKYESKILWRNWFFRIVFAIGIFFVIIFNLGVFSEVDTPRWFVQANSWIQPYATMILISIIQAATVIFLASGLIKKDKKIDTNEVFFVRPISNLDYVLGKAFALFKLFFWVNLALLIIPLIVNLTSPILTFNPVAFIVYPLVTSLPTIIFTTGIAFLVVTLLKNQPITIVLLIGLAGVQIIYYFDKFSNILDFMAFRLPMYTSEMAGFADLEFALLQRSFYIIAGIGFLFLTAFFLDRLAGSKVIRLANGFMAILLLGVASYVMFNLWNMRQGPITMRNNFIEVNDHWTEVPNIDISAHHIALTHQGDQIASTSTLTVTNQNQQTLKQIYFTLNPDLKVNEVSFNGQPVDFKRDLQIVALEGNINLDADEKAEVVIKYSGTINEAIAHLEVDQERYESSRNYFSFSLQKKYAFLQPDYALLTKDVLWYPDTQVGYSKKSPTKERNTFIDFQLDVSLENGLVPVSQGQLDIENDTYKFRPENAIPQISLAIGHYVKKSITVDSIDYIVYHYPKNDFFLKRLDQLADTLDVLITDLVNEYEDGQQLNYPFSRLQFVEAPIQFTAFNKIYEGQQAFVQPETVYWPEEGGNIREFDFRRQMKNMNRQAREENLTLGEKEKQANLFNDLIKKRFTKQGGELWVFEGRDEDEPDYSLFPNLYTYNSGVVSQEWALLNRSIADYLQNDKQAKNDFSRNLNGISFTEECNMLMRESTITEILTSETEFNKIQKAVSLKGQYLFSYLGQLVGEERFKEFLHQWVNSHQHDLTTYAEFRSVFNNRFDMDIDPIIKKVYFDTAQAAFKISDLQKYEVLDDDRKRYQVLMNIQNVGDNDGVVEIKFRKSDGSDDDGFFRRRVNQEVEEEDPGYFTVIKQDEIKQVGFVLDEKPKFIIINTIISRNIPSVINNAAGTFSPKKNIALFEGERVINELAASTQYELVVDNEDPGFSYFSPIKATYLRAYLDSRNDSDKKYYGNWFRSYSKWLATTGSNFYGEVVRSAHFTRSGSGEKTAKWTPELKEEGFYDLYVYMKGKNQNQYRGNDNRQFNYRYIVHHGDGQDNIKFNISNAEPGWNYLGSYYFHQTGGSVELTDECDLRTVYADAVKWVKQ